MVALAIRRCVAVAWCMVPGALGCSANPRQARTLPRPAPGEGLRLPRDVAPFLARLRLPTATHCAAPAEAVNVVMTEEAIHGGGDALGEWTSGEADARPASLPELVEFLRRRRSLWIAANTPSEIPFPGQALLWVDRATPAWALKRVVLTVAAAGYGNQYLMARRAAHPGRVCGILMGGQLRSNWRLDDPSDPALVVELLDDRSVRLVWRSAAGTSGEPRVEKLEDLNRAAAEEWRARGVHRKPSDGTFDRALVDVPEATPYALILPLFDALEGVRRDVNGYAWTLNSLGVFSPRLAVDDRELAAFRELTTALEAEQ